LRARFIVTVKYTCSMVTRSTLNKFCSNVQHSTPIPLKGARCDAAAPVTVDVDDGAALWEWADSWETSAVSDDRHQELKLG
jgi:hypothetical protein